MQNLHQATQAVSTEVYVRNEGLYSEEIPVEASQDEKTCLNYQHHGDHDWDGPQKWPYSSCYRVGGTGERSRGENVISSTFLESDDEASLAQAISSISTSDAILKGGCYFMTTQALLCEHAGTSLMSRSSWTSDAVGLA